MNNRTDMGDPPLRQGKGGPHGAIAPPSGQVMMVRPSPKVYPEEEVRPHSRPHSNPQYHGPQYSGPSYNGPQYTGPH
jgi:hypothetical protein